MELETKKLKFSRENYGRKYRIGFSRKTLHSNAFSDILNRVVREEIVNLSSASIRPTERCDRKASSHQKFKKCILC
jgi:hypothetical protein